MKSANKYLLSIVFQRFYDSYITLPTLFICPKRFSFVKEEYRDRSNSYGKSKSSILMATWLRSLCVRFLPTSVKSTSENFLLVPFALEPYTIAFSILGCVASTATSLCISAFVNPISSAIIVPGFSS